MKENEHCLTKKQKGVVGCDCNSASLRSKTPCDDFGTGENLLPLAICLSPFPYG